MIKSIVFSIFPKTNLVVKRFPVPVFFSFLLCLFSVANFSCFEKEAGSYFLFCGLFFFVSLKLLAERKKWSLNRYFFIGIPLFSVMAWYINTNPEMFLLIGLGLFFSVFIAPFMISSSTSLQLWAFKYNLWGHLGVTIFTSIILYVLFVAVFSSIAFLFDVKFYSDLYSDAFLVGATFFAPMMIMAGIPERYDVVRQDDPKIVQFLLTYIIFPFLLLYTIIFYALD